MRTQPSDSPDARPSELIPPSGVLVLSGYGLDVRVWRGRLRVADGIGRDRREALVHRATGRLRRLVVLGHTGSVSLEAVRLLADVGAGYLQVDADGRVLAAFGPQGTDRPGLRRAQARALDTPVGNDVARRLIAEKVASQAETLLALAEHVSGVGGVGPTLADAARRLHVATGRDEIRFAEAIAAGAYWEAWSPLVVRFAKRDEPRIPAHWLTFGSRTSPLTGGPRLAGNPANALLNYLYALLEAEATIAARVVGLDPGLGVLHADQLNRDSLAADLMEPVRPLVDRHLLELVTTHVFAAADFFETRQGVCRVTPPLARELAKTLPRWRTAVGRVAEVVAERLLAGGAGPEPLPTPISGRNRSAARSARPRPIPSRPAQAMRRRCSWCGGPTTGARRTCSADCREAVRADQDRETFSSSGPQRLRELRAAGVEPLGADSRRQLGARQRARQREENEWNAEHPDRQNPESFRREVLPSIQAVPVRELSRRTGLSVAYCARIRRGEEVPHARWWELLVPTPRAGRGGMTGGAAD
jgi:CRISPR-associated endonuclease Cas1